MRRGPRREPRRRILILCEGEKTEPGYLQSLQAEFRHPLVEIEIEGHGEDPKGLVERAVARKHEAEREARRRGDDFLRYDEIWCVFDWDDHDRLPDAQQQAQAHAIRLAISNPCFELWALLHFQDQTAFLVREKVRGSLKKHLPEYQKSLPFDRLRPGYQKAVERAELLDRRCEERGCPRGNPSTGVYRLTELIRTEGRETTGSQIRKMRGFLRGIDTSDERDPDRF